MVFGFVNVVAVVIFGFKVNVIFGIAIAFGSGNFFGNGRDRDGLVAAQQGVDGGFVFGDFAQGDDRDLVAFCGNKPSAICRARREAASTRRKRLFSSLRQSSMVTRAMGSPCMCWYGERTAF